MIDIDVWLGKSSHYRQKSLFKYEPGSSQFCRLTSVIQIWPTKILKQYEVGLSNILYWTVWLRMIKKKKKINRKSISSLLIWRALKYTFNYLWRLADVWSYYWLNSVRNTTRKKNPFCIAQKGMWAENTAHHLLGKMCSELFSFEHCDLFQKKIIFINKWTKWPHTTYCPHGKKSFHI